MTATPANGTPPYSYLWSGGAGNTQSVTVSPATTTTYNVTVTDANNCSGTDQVTVTVVDVRCGNKNRNDKVIVCHNGRELCVDVHAVPAHLAHGDLIGPCNLGKIGTEAIEIPEGFVLEDNYPNPFNPSTTIRFGVPHDGVVNLAVFNTLGQKVAQLVEGGVTAGYHSVAFDASNLASGLYMYRIQAGDFVATKKLALLR